ncbi:hypothetical protein [Ramlibacter tataouinensis]|uniref:hypothetical protein n=1 Tax=Ramlibacter tataouinensis TaxID=94132 RepID=UPI003F7F88D5
MTPPLTSAVSDVPPFDLNLSQGAHELNKMAFPLNQAANRACFKEDSEAYMDGFRLPMEQRELVCQRDDPDWRAAADQGRNAPADRGEHHQAGRTDPPGDHSGRDGVTQLRFRHLERYRLPARYVRCDRYQARSAAAGNSGAAGNRRALALTRGSDGRW